MSDQTKLEVLWGMAPDSVRNAPTIAEALYQLDREVAAKLGGRPYDTLSAMSGRAVELGGSGFEHDIGVALASILDRIQPNHAEKAAVDQARREAQGFDDHVPLGGP